MQKVLLAINGISPNQKAFSYAVQLCKRIKAELNILNIISLEYCSRCLNRVRRSARNANRVFEGYMVAAAFAEAGEHEIANEMREQALKNINELLTGPERAGVPCHLTMRSGNPDEEVVKYVKDHRDVVLTIYDTPKKESSGKTKGGAKRRALKGIRAKLATPLVVMRS